MRIPDHKLDEFIRIYREEFGTEIERNEAAELAQDVIMLYEALSKLPPEEGYVPEPTQRPEDRPPIGFQS